MNPGFPLRSFHVIFAGLGTLAASPAFAQAPPQSGFDAHGFRLAAHDADPRDPLVVVRPGRFGEQSWFAGGVFEYASQPLVFQTDAGEVVELDDVVAANLSGGYAPHDRVRIDLSAPLFFYAEGTDGPLGAGLGDVRATGLIALVTPEDDGGLGLGFLVNADVPTGRPDAWLGLYTIAGGVGMTATWESERATVGAMASSQLRPNTKPEERPAYTRGGDAFGWGASVGYLVAESTGVTLEAHGEVPVDSAVREAIGVGAEAILSFRHVRENGGFLTAGLGTGMSRGAGASPLRLLVGGGFGQPDGARKDTDGDGIEDRVDACPEMPETMNGYEDDDGCSDALPKLLVRAVGPDGAVREEAVLRVTGPTTIESTGELVAQGPDLLPGSEVALSARLGSCLEGSSTVKMERGDLAVEVQLQPRRPSRVFVEVVDAEGQPVEGATVEVRSAEPACGPDAPVALDGGRGEVPLGVGRFKAVVRAPGMLPHSAGFMLEDADQHVLRVTLKQSRVRVEADAIQILEKVYFDTGAATIQERSFPVLDDVATVVRINGIRRLEIQGHTDDQGDDQKNLALSQARAASVKLYLVQKGVDPEVLVPKGYGETAPLEPGTSADARAKNRRVEFRILPSAEAATAASAPAPDPNARPEDVFARVQVFFDTGDGTIDAKSLPKLDAVAAAMPESGRIEIGAYAEVGSAEPRASAVSFALAEIVKEYLVGQGVDASRLKAEGKGAAPEGADPERFRVDFRLLDGE